MTRSLNIQYSNNVAEINMTGMERLGDVRKAVKQKFANTLSVHRIQFYNGSEMNPEQLITDLDDINPDCYKKEGPCLFIGIKSLAQDSNIANSIVPAQSTSRLLH